MINDELHTAFRWYDDVMKQNRFKNYCEPVCPFKLVTPCDRFLPFEIKTTGLSSSLTQWLVYDIDGNEVADFSSCIDTYLDITTIAEFEYITFADASLASCGFDFPCGAYYSYLTDGTVNLYSEVFEVVYFQDREFSQDLFQPNLPWRWYDNQLKENRFKTNCVDDGCDFCLMSSNERLLPFQFKRISVPDLSVTSFRLVNLEDPTCGITLETGLIEVVPIAIYDYLIYDGAAIIGLTPGKYEGIIVANGVTYYSEPICIRCDLGDLEGGNYLLQEDYYKILQETDYGILIEP